MPEEREIYMARAFELIKDLEVPSLCLGVEIARKLPPSLLQGCLESLIENYRSTANNVGSFSNPVSLSWTSLRRLAEITALLDAEKALELTREVLVMLERVRSKIGAAHYMTVVAALGKYVEVDWERVASEWVGSSGPAGSEVFIALMTAFGALDSDKHELLIRGTRRSMSRVGCAHCQGLFNTAADLYDSRITVERKLSRVLMIREDYLFVIGMKALLAVCSGIELRSEFAVEVLSELSQRPRHVTLQILSIWMRRLFHDGNDRSVQKLYAICGGVEFMRS
jgi:hypothetical protein